MILVSSEFVSIHVLLGSQEQKRSLRRSFLFKFYYFRKLIVEILKFQPELEEKITDFG